MAKKISKFEPSAEQNNQDRPSPEEIAARAYAYYDKDGRVDGRDTEYWLRAEADLIAERQNGQTKSAPRAASRNRKSVGEPRNN